MERRLGLLFVFAVSIVVSGCFGDISGTVSEDGAGLQGVTIVLTGKAFDMTVTDETGSFLFQNIRGGNYTVAMEPPAGYTRFVTCWEQRTG